MLSLDTRASHLTELMDSPDCDKEELFNTYRQFSHVNSLISGWQSLFNAHIAPLARIRNKEGESLRILDIGCGGGDICLKFSEWSISQKLAVDITGIDPDPRAIEYTEMLNVPENTEFIQTDSGELLKTGRKYDVAVTNHLLHHLQEDELLQLCMDAGSLASSLVLFNDIRRSRIGFVSFGLIAPLLYRSSFICRDGITSIRRSFSYRELNQLVPAGWVVKKLFPFRLLLVRRTDS